jgi:hypothetical protein
VIGDDVGSWSDVYTGFLNVTSWLGTSKYCHERKDSDTVTAAARLQLKEVCDSQPKVAFRITFASLSHARPQLLLDGGEHLVTGNSEGNAPVAHPRSPLGAKQLLCGKL